MNRAKILVADDEADIRRLLRLLLSAEGYEVLEAGNGEEALAAAAREDSLDLVLLDIMMPGMNGIETCRRLRQITKVPILFLTASTLDDDKAAAYRSGGDDFLAKPFSQPELMLKVQALIRRYREYRNKPPEHSGAAFDVISKRHCILLDGERLDLTDTEYEILRLLIERRGTPVSMREIYERAWGERFLSSSSNTVMVHILNLRRKLEEDASQPKIIRTVWGKGYQID